MALRLKTIEFATQTDVTTLAAQTKKVLTGSTQIFIPELTLTFKSCMLEVFVAGDNSAVASLTGATIGFSLGVAAESSSVLQSPSAISGSMKESWIFSRDVTSYFTSNWTGTAMNWYTAWTGSGPAFANLSAKITITYQYEESTSNTQIKTIRIPVESTKSLLTTSWQFVGSGVTQAIPPLKGTYLPEIGVTIRQAYLEIQSNDAMNATTAFSGQTRINGGTPFNFWRTPITLNSARWLKSIYDLTPFNLTGSSYYSLEMVTSLTSRFTVPGGLIVCTYQYDATGSTTIYNSLMLGGIDTPGFIGGTTATDQAVWERNIYIEEPNIISIKESAVALYFTDSGGFNLSVQVTGSTSGQTTASVYTITAGATQAGQYSLFHRIDANGQNKKGLFLNRGKNLYNIRVFSNTAQSGWNLSGVLYLNYTSGKHTLGVGAHTHTCFQYVLSGQTATRVSQTTVAVAAQIPEAYYYLSGFLTYIPYISGVGTDQAITLQAGILSGESYGQGWQMIYNGQGRTDNVNSLNTAYGAARTAYMRWVGDPDSDRLDIERPRQYRLDTDPLTYSYCGYYYTYNAITYVVSGTCTGYVSDGSGIDIDVFRIITTDHYEHILDLKTIAGGTFSGIFIDNTDTLFIAARQDDTHVGRSPNGTAG